ncbi:MAG: GNAT family N-acetyltransferase [Ginsengibacter sp.]
MTINAIKTNLPEILPLRNLFLQENNFQIRYNAQHERGWSDSYLIMHNEERIGYGSVMENENSNVRDSIFEFYIIPSFRNLAPLAFLELIHASKSSYIICQSNDLLLLLLLFQFGENINADTILLEESFTSSMHFDNLIFRKRNDNDIVFEHKAEPVGSFVLEFNNEIVATGGFLLHYNLPFADLYMEVREDCRRKGFGSFLIQKIKKQCYLAGRVPAARTGLDNIASRATLIKAGFKVAGFMLLAKIKSQP